MLPSSVHLYLVPMAVAAAIAAGEAIISASGVVEVVKNYAVSFAKEEFKGLWDLKQKVTTLSKTLESIQDDLKVAEERQYEREDIRKWLQELKNVAYDLEDVLDDYALEGPAEDEENMGAVTQWTRLAINSLWLLCDVPLSCFGIATPVAPLRNISHRLQSVEKELERINQEKEGLGFLQGLSGEASPSGSLPSGASTYLTDKEQPMVGRHETRNEIKRALLNSSSKITVVAITGLGGMGKTTLAQEIFSDKDMQKPFPIRKWVFVGVKFDAASLIDQIIRENKDDDLPKDLCGLQSKLVEKIKDNGFLIVLDDAWCTDGKEWDKLWRPLTHREKGGAIVVTARDQAVARAIPRGSAYSEHPLGEMPEEECLEILKRWALVDQKPERYHHREWQCKQIVKKLKGVPLAADIMGRFLGKHLDDDDIWRNVVTDEGWSQKDEEELVHRVTGLSYRHLPSHLKPCFTYCSIFPKGFVFDKETLVRMWVAQGYIPPRENQLMEHIGSVYFHNLCQMSFLQLKPSGYVMHDLVNDFAQKIFPEGRGRIVAGDREAPEQVRHVSLHLDESDLTVFQNLQKYKKLRTLMIYAPDITAPALDMLVKFKHIRVLVLKCYKISEFPESIGHLKLLRYLDISETGVRALPELACGLLHLQVLKLHRWFKLPQLTSKLVNLRCIDGAIGDLANLQHIGRLTSLQELRWFWLQKNRRSRIEELGSLNNLHKALTIDDLGNVQSKEEALQAKLKDKVYLEELELGWALGRALSENVGEVRFINSQVLEGLCPPPNLKRLVINGNLGARPPSWMMEQHHLLPSSLVSVCLSGCRHWEYLPALGQLPLLRVLSVDREHDVKKVGQEFFCATDHSFPRLEFLSFRNMEEWEGWDYMPCGRVFPSLQKLHVKDCPKLASLSPILRHMTTLRELTIKDCAQLSSLEEDGGDWMFASLRHLKIFDCPRLTSLSPLLRDLTALERLDINGCDHLSSLLVPPILPSLNFLNIKSCSMLKELATLPSSSQKQQEENDLGDQSLPSSSFPRLEELYTDNRCLLMWILPKKLRSLKTLVIDSHGDCFTEAEEEGWTHLTSLTHVTFREFNRLPEGGLPASLQYLHIVDCPHLQTPPSSLHTLPSLDHLILERCPEINRLLEGGLSASLRELRNNDCPHLQTLLSSLHTLPSLYHLELERCPEINCMPEGSLPASLQELYIIDCPHLQTLPSSLHTLPSLVHLKLERCPEINRLPEGSLPASLQYLRINNCPHFQTLPPSLHTLPSLVHLKLERCPEINRLPEGGLPASLQKLYIIDCPHLQTLPSSLHTLPSLYHLTLMHCPEINRLPEGGLPASLQELHITNCPQLAESCREGGPDHHKIPCNMWIRS